LLFLAVLIIPDIMSVKKARTGKKEWVADRFSNGFSVKGSCAKTGVINEENT